MLSKTPNPYEIIKKSVDNMNSLSSVKYKQTPNDIKKNSLNSEISNERFNILRLKKIKEERSLTRKIEQESL